jgi:hypothetical protein
MTQIWIGTTYGLAIILNLISNKTNVHNSSNSSMSQDILSTQKATPSATIAPTGVIHALKGQIVDIAFLDINGNLLSQTSYTSSSESSYQKRQTFQSSSGVNQVADDLNDLDIDFSYLSNNAVSNSIAENFGGSSNSASTGSAINNINESASSSPITTPTLGNNIQSTTITDDIFSSSLGKDTSSKTSKAKKLLSATRSSKLEFGTTKDNSESDNYKIQESKQFVVITSETQIKIIALPTQTCIHKYAITEGSVVKASVVVINCMNSNFLIIFEDYFYLLYNFRFNIFIVLFNKW